MRGGEMSLQVEVRSPRRRASSKPAPLSHVQHDSRNRQQLPVGVITKQQTAMEQKSNYP